MHAITIREPGGPDVLEWAEVPDPVAGPGEVLLDVAATAVNRADLLQRQGHYPPPPGASEVLGLECSGTVAALGEGVTGWAVGDRVCALLAGGGYGSRVAVPAAQLLPLPEGVDLVTAASLPEVACTVWSNVVMLGRLAEGETFLVHGGAGGIGTHAIQVAKALGAKVAVTAGSDERLERCRELGADITVNYKTQDFVSEVKADVILDNMGAAYLDRNVDALNPDGRIVVIGMQGGVKGELNLGKLLAKRASISATGLRFRPVDGPQGKGRIVADVRDRLWPLIASGQVKPVVDRVLPIREAADAHRALEGGSVFGKVVLEF
ncbi:NAD(P)H-quinone oxidoreductase [Saccharothrix variisporea]|uniref:Putative PIG3 family NAD(P)H quinone oxidoreductase n=1 Tax=Saccharothrix variisporea TaxID=543527 RepID=A0A495XA50_9PSEU|nr:NAD(P)H-quinone oxidoreductase [Saccharothrix variisporea]RKT71361.1 putative PIG3 family NAD(P)H quinone oxidoreductase [Saccharothrix variisporea]